ncbi:hypothetical protein BT69DRAFT_1279593, partial [Atractiella rhizophila]
MSIFPPSSKDPGPADDWRNVSGCSIPTVTDIEVGTEFHDLIEEGVSGEFIIESKLMVTSIPERDR